MSFDPTSIGKAHSNLPPRIIISGEPKAGKTTWAARAPGALIIPVVGEEGCDDLIDENKIPIEVDSTPKAKTFAELVTMLEWFRDADHKFKSLVIDSLSSAERMIHHDLVESDPKAKSIEQYDGGYGKGYTATVEKFRLLTQILSDIRENRKCAIILVAHVTPKSLTDHETLDKYDAFELALNKKVVALFEQWCDFMLFASKSLYVNSDGKATERERKLIVHGIAHLPVGGRSIASLMPKELPLNWQSFQDAVKTAKTQTKKD